MFSFIIRNAATIIISLIVLSVVILLIIKMCKDKKSGKSSCGGSCEHCAMSGKCHSVK